MKLYPNPSKDVLNIKYNGNSEIESIRIFNLLGQNVYESTFNNPRLNLIDVSNFSSGVYSILIRYSNKEIELIKFEVSK